MPTYEYECDACAHRFEQFQAMSDAPLKTCPVCKKRKLIRLIGAGAGIIFKGSGFYETDYKRKQQPAAKSEGESGGSSSSTSSSASSSSSPSSSSTESKPAAAASEKK